MIKIIIGSLGSLIFEVSNFKVCTFSDFKRDTKAKFAEHEIIANPPKLEFLHRDLESISFTMTFHKSLGVDPFEETQKLRDMCKTGEANYLIIGDHAYGEFGWIVESLSESVEFWDGDATMLTTKINVQLKEYVGDFDEDDSNLDG